MPSWRSVYAWPLHRFREVVRLYPYTQPQIHAFTYRVSIFADKAGIVTLAIPLPPQTSYQRCAQLHINLPNIKDMHDSKFGNRCFVVSLQVPAGQTELSAFHGEGRMDPLTSYMNEAASFTDQEETPYTHPRDPRIQALARKIGAGSCARETARRINAYIVDHLTYGDPIDGLYSDLEALTREHVDCGGFDTLFVSLCLAQKIPARVVSGFWMGGQDKQDMHAWAEFQDEDGRWIPVDPSVEHLARAGRTQKSGRFGFVGSDRLRLSHGSPIPLEWNNKMVYAPILQHPFVLEGPKGARCRGTLQTSVRTSRIDHPSAA